FARALHPAENAGRPARPPGFLDELDVYTSRTPEECREGVLYTRRSGSRDQAGGAARKRADDTWHDRRRALRLHAVRPGSQPGTTRGESPDVVDHGSAGRES